MDVTFLEGAPKGHACATCKKPAEREIVRKHEISDGVS